MYGCNVLPLANQQWMKPEEECDRNEAQDSGCQGRGDRSEKRERIVRSEIREDSERGISSQWIEI